MALTPSTMLELETVAPDFSLPDPHNSIYTLSEQRIDKGLLVLFICNHCPYVIHIREKLVEKVRDYQAKGIQVVAINSNDFEQYPDDSPTKMAETIQEFNFTFPYLVDEKQHVAQAYRAACTPDIYLFDSDKKLVYRGQFDSARPGNKEVVSGADLTDAITSLLTGAVLPQDQKPSMGCNIKWRKGNEPDYFG